MIMIIIMIINIIIDRCIETPVDAHTLSDRWVPQEGVKSDSRLRDCGFHRSASSFGIEFKVKICNYTPEI